jgi:hypothetical protein
MEEIKGLPVAMDAAARASSLEYVAVQPQGS